MAKFKINLKITGFELSVEGNREDVPLMTQAVGQQFVGLLGPAADIVEGEIIEVSSQPAPLLVEERTAKKPPRRRTPTSSAPRSNNGDKKDVAVDWRHDTSKWGSPQQDWVTAEKAMWLLHVAANEVNAKEMAANQIADTFNKHFRQAGPIRVGNVSRDLGVQKRHTPALVSEDTTKSPPAWFLTEAGIKRANELASKARGQTTG